MRAYLSVTLGSAAADPGRQGAQDADRKPQPPIPIPPQPAPHAACWRWVRAAAIVVVGLGAFALLPPVRQPAADHDPVQIAANDTHATPRMLENSSPFSFADLVERVSPAVVTITSETMTTASDER